VGRRHAPGEQRAAIHDEADNDDDDDMVIMIMIMIMMMLLLPPLHQMVLMIFLTASSRAAVAAASSRLIVSSADCWSASATLSVAPGGASTMSPSASRTLLWKSSPLTAFLLKGALHREEDPSRFRGRGAERGMCMGFT